jgi:cytochrome c oxidase assembly protein Cox11
MAFSNGGTAVLIDSDQLPDGYTKPTPTTFTDHEFKEHKIYTVAKSTVEDPDAAITFAALVTAVNTAIGVWAQLQWVATNLSIWSEIASVTTNMVPGHADVYTDTVTNYLVSVWTYAKNP